METSGQTMGLNEILNDDLTPTSSNNIDVHMLKSTEYGAMAILSASGFGYSGKLQDAPVKSTTGNVTGVYITGTRDEWTAGVCEASTVRKDARYYDLYTINNQTSAKVGDALGLDTYTNNPGCAGWHGASFSITQSWINSEKRGFVRGLNGIFFFHAWASYDGYYEWTTNSYCGRGVAVAGSGL